MRLFSKKILLPLLVGSLLLTGCSSNKIQEQKKTVYAMDTIMDLTAYTDNSDVLNDAEKKINEIDKELRRGSQESEIYAVNNNEETKLTDETAYIVETALNIGKKTSGAFDITIAPVMDLWGFYNQNFYVPTDDEIKNALKNVRLTGKRQEFMQFGSVTVINDAYNASPASMSSALKTLHAVKDAKGGRAVAVLADMLELGALSVQAHKEVGEMAAAEGVDVLITYGAEAVHTGRAAQEKGVKTFICHDRAEAAKILSGILRNDDIILLKGSHSMQVDGLIDLVLKK